MHKDVKKHQMTNTQLFILSQKVCQWWNAVFIQADRFFDVLNTSHGGTPWDNCDKNSMFVADRMFLITAIHNAVEDLQKLNRLPCNRISAARQVPRFVASATKFLFPDCICPSVVLQCSYIMRKSEERNL